MSKKQSLVRQLRGATRLAVQATRGVTDVVEAMHLTIGAGPSVLGRPLESVTRILTAPTYATIRGVTTAVGAGLDQALAQLEPLIDLAGPEGGQVQAILNGVLGDYLAETHNPLAIDMVFVADGTRLELKASSLASLPSPKGRLLLLVHGSSMDETGWNRRGHDHGLALASRLGLMPLYLRYNSGRHISQNGRELAERLEQLIDAWPVPVTELVIVAHSMGGLVSRSAIHAAEAQSLRWRSLLQALVTLGTPHHGAPLEQGGNLAQWFLGVSRYSAPLARLGRLRSAGVTDLRYGYVLDEHWAGRDRFEHTGDVRGELNLPEGVACYAVAALLKSPAASATAGPEVFLGDGLVPLDSALGRHPDPARALFFDADHCHVLEGAGHLDLLDSQEVYARLLSWLEQGRAMEKAREE